MPTVLWVFTAALTDLLLTCVLLRWLPERRERWIPFVPFPLIVLLTLTLRLTAGTPWPAALAACTGFLWGTLLALLPFRGWVSSWTLPVAREDRLRWYEAALIVPAALTPLSTRRTDAALEKAFAPREVVRERGPFPPLMGVALLVLPVLGAAASNWAV